MADWESSSSWYKKCVGEKGHYYHQTVVIPNALRLLGKPKKGSLLDLGCGAGIFAKHLPNVEYYGIDLSPSLIAHAKKGQKQRFFVADASEPLPIEKRDFDYASLMLSLQNMEHPARAIANAAHHLKPNGLLLIVLNHPCFRIPRQSSWGVDPKSQIQYRRIDSYLSSQKIPIQTSPSKKGASAITYSFHEPLSLTMAHLAAHGFVVTALEEWCSDKTSTGKAARMENRARKEIPLFLALCASASLR